LPFVLAGLGVIGLRSADDEPGLSSAQLQALAAQLQAALDQQLLHATDGGDKVDGDGTGAGSGDDHPPAKRQRHCAPTSATAKAETAAAAAAAAAAVVGGEVDSAYSRELMCRVGWYRAGQIRALRQACCNVTSLCERVRMAEEAEAEADEEDDEEDEAQQDEAQDEAVSS
jgi:hypothetical protein